jgi:hypothetical protein
VDGQKLYSDEEVWLTNDDIAVNLCYDILLIKAIQNLALPLPNPIRLLLHGFLPDENQVRKCVTPMAL